MANTPGPADTAIKAGAGTVTVNVAVTVGALTVNAGTVTQTQSLTVSNTLTIAGGTLTSNNALTVNGATNITGGTLTINAAGARTFTGAVTISTGATWTNSGNRAVTFGNNLSNSGTFTSGTALQTFTAAPATLGGTAAMTFSGAVTANNGLVVDKAGSTVRINGALNAGSLTVTAGTLNLANTVAVTGATSISGTLAHTTNTGTRTFTGAVAINSGGTWSNTNEAVSFGNNLSNDGTFTSGTGAQTFTGADPQLGGGAPMTFSGAVTANNGLVINRTSAAATVVVTGTLGVTGPLQVTQGELTTNGNLTVSTNLTVSAAGTLNLNNNATVTGTTSVSGILGVTSTTGTKTFTGAVTINNGGTWNNSANEPVTMGNSLTNNGTFTSGTGTYTFQTTAGAVWAGTSGLSFDGAVSVTASRTNDTTVTVTGTLSVASNVTFTNNSTVTALGNVTGGNAKSIWTNAVNSTLNAFGTLMTTGVLNASDNPNTVNYAGAAQTVKLPSTNTYNNLTLSGSGTKTMPNTAMNITGNFDLPATGSASATLAANLTITGNLLVNTNGGTLSLATFTANRTAAGGTLEVGAGSTLRIGGTNTAPANYATRTYHPTSTTDYFGTNQIVRNETYGNLTLSGSGNKTIAAGTTNIEGNLLISAGPTYLGTTNNPTVNLRGNFTRNGTFNSGTGVFTFNGTSMVTPQTLTGASTFTNMAVNNAGVGLSLANDITIANTGSLALTNGVVTTGAATNMIVTRACNVVAAVTRTNGFVAGNLRKAIPAGASTCTYEIGSGSSYTPAVLTFAVGTGAGNITASTTGVIHPQSGHASSGIDATKALNRYWTITNNTVTLPVAGYSASFNYINGTPVDITGGTPANFLVERWTGAAWVATTSSACTPAPAGNLCRGVSGLTAAAGFGDFWAGEAKVVVPPTPDSFNAVEVGGTVTGRLFTKLVGRDFVLDIVAVQGGALHVAFGGDVRIDVVTGGSAGADCGGNPSPVSTAQDVTLKGGRITMVTPFNVPTAAADARVRIRYPAGAGPYTITSCSTDNFTIRPQSFSSIQAPSLGNTGTTGSPNIKAGATFTIEATAGTGYTGMPAITLASITPHTGGVAGVLTGSFGAGDKDNSWIASGSFTYSEVGNFTINALAVIDDTFTDGSADKTNNDCIVGSFSNTAVGGKYGCGFRNPSASSTIGRFTPDHFIVTPGTLTNRQALGCGSTFTYEGEQLRVGFLVTARNGLTTPTTTQNYTTASGFARFVGTTAASYGIGAVDLADATPPAAATALTSRISASASATGDWLSGTLNAIVDLSVNRAASADGPFESFRIGILPQDADGITVRASDLNLDTTVPADTADRVLVGSSIIRFGRLAIGNASGSPLLPLPVRVEAQYWNASSFVTHAADSCTPVLTSVTDRNVAMGNYTGGLAITVPSPNCKTGISGGGALNKGRLTLQLSAPKTAGAVDLTLNLGSSALGTTTCRTSGALPVADTPANRAYLQSGTGFAQNPSARATFGAQSGAEEQIHRQENY